MTTFMTKRVRFAAATACLFLATQLVIYEFELHLHNTSRATGFSLFLLMLVLALFNGKKKLPFLPMGTSATWLRFHSFAGIFSLGLFLLHAGFHWPTGGMETVIFFLFYAVALSGLLGLFLSRILPKRLNQRGSNVVFETIPNLRRELAERSRAAVLLALEKTNMSTLADFYAFRLSSFFARERNFWAHVFGLQFHMNNIWMNVNGVKRYLNNEEISILAEVEQMIREKDELDHQFALQKVLKFWLFVHIPLTFCLILFAAVHGTLAWVLGG